MLDYERTELWKRTLGEQAGDPAQAARTHLREQLRRSRRSAGQLAGQLQSAYPALKSQGASRFDALWERVDLLLGPEYPLNAAEAFVLGGALILYDLGAGLAGLPGGEAELRKTQEWKDALATCIRRETDRSPTPGEMSQPTPEYVRLATEEALHLLAVKNARRLGQMEWKGEGGEALHLLEDPALRQRFGELAGDTSAESEEDCHTGCRESGQ